MKRCDLCKKESSRHVKGKQFSLERKGCFSAMPNIVYKVPSVCGYPGINFHKCPTNYINYKCRDLINQNSSFNNGIMPYSGGMDEQPAKFVECMGLIDNLLEEHRKNEEKKLKALSNGKRSPGRNINR